MIDQYIQAVAAEGIQDSDWQLAEVDLRNYERVCDWIIGLVLQHGRVCIDWGRFRNEILAEHRHDPIVHRTLKEMRMDWSCDYRVVWDNSPGPKKSTVVTHLLRKGIFFGTGTSAVRVNCSEREFIGMMVGLTEQPDGVKSLRSMLRKKKGPCAKFIGIDHGRQYSREGVH